MCVTTQPDAYSTWPGGLVAHHDIVHQLQLHFLTGHHLHWSRVTRAAKKPLKRLLDVHLRFQPDTCGLKNLHPAKGIGGEQKGRWSRSRSVVKAEPPSEPCHGQNGNHRNIRQHGVGQKGGGGGGGDRAADLLEQPLDDRPSLPDHLGRAPLHRHLRRRHGFREQDQVCWIHQRLQRR